MALEKQVTVDEITLTTNGAVLVREVTRIMEDGVEISSKFHRHVVVPGADYSKEDAKVQAICSLAQTPEVVAAYKASQVKLDEPKV
jgi:hypothetical protein